MTQIYQYHQKYFVYLYVLLYNLDDNYYTVTKRNSAHIFLSLINLGPNVSRGVFFIFLYH